MSIFCVQKINCQHIIPYSSSWYIDLETNVGFGLGCQISNVICFQQMFNSANTPNIKIDNVFYFVFTLAEGDRTSQNYFLIVKPKFLTKTKKKPIVRYYDLKSNLGFWKIIPCKALHINSSKNTIDLYLLLFVFQTTDILCLTNRFIFYRALSYTRPYGDL